MLKRITSLVFLIFSLQIFAQENLKIRNKTDFSIGDSFKFNSKILNEERTINVYLPHSYHQSKIKNEYPVIYLLDGSADEDFIHIAGLVQYGAFSWINMIPETIVVGIANVDRKRDYTFHTENQELKKEFPTTGKSEIFIQFLENELKPLIDQNYRISDVSTLIGQSLGGLLATEILFKNPDMFDNYIIVSPSLWWDDASLQNYQPKAYTGHKKIFIGVGKEGEIMESSAKNLYQKLNKLNHKNTEIYFQFFKNRDHGDTLHLAAYAAFEKIFKIKEN